MDVKSDFLVELGKKIIELREKKNIKQTYLSDQTGLETSEISKYEQGKINLTIGTFLKFAQALNVQPKELLNFDFDIEKYKSQ